MDPKHTQPPIFSKTGFDPMPADVIFLLGHTRQVYISKR